jgi:hypothetical protein
VRGFVPRVGRRWIHDARAGAGHAHVCSHAADTNPRSVRMADPGRRASGLGMGRKERKGREKVWSRTKVVCSEDGRHDHRSTSASHAASDRAIAYIAHAQHRIGERKTPDPAIEQSRAHDASRRGARRRNGRPHPCHSADAGKVGWV